MLLRSFFPFPMLDTTPGDGGGGGGGGTPPPASPWYAGKPEVTDEIAGYFSRRGWDKDPVAAALGAGQAHREAEKSLGIPSDRILRLPKEANDPHWSEVWQRLGTPKDKAEYDLSGVKMAGDKPLDKALEDVVRNTAHSLNLPKDLAPKLANALLKLDSDRLSAEQANKAARLAEERESLNKNWGMNKEANMVIAKAAAGQFGMQPSEVDALEQVMGYARTMEMLRNIGVRIGEDRFVRNDLKPGGGVLSKEEAADRKAELMRDKDWVKRYTSGGAAEKKEMDSLLRLIAGAG